MQGSSQGLSFPFGRWTCRATALSISLLSVIPLFGQERGAPWKRHVIDGTSRGADGTRTADVNGDGLPDIATVWEESGVVRAYLHPGADRVRKPWPGVTVGRVGSPEDAVFVDLDGDGAVDVVSSCEGRVRSLFVHWAPRQKGAYLHPQAWKTEALPAARGTMSWMFCLPLQVDGERGIDLVVGAKGGGARIGWLESPGNPRDLAAWKWHPLREAGWIMSLVATDMDGDGDRDVLLSDRRGKKRGCSWLENPGRARAASSWKEHPIGGADREVMFLTQADLDGDGRRDVLAAVRGRELVYFRRGAGKPETWTPHVIPLPRNTGTAKSVAVADIDLDGRRDIVLSCENAAGASGVLWLSARASFLDAHWDSHEIGGPSGRKFDLVRLVDLDLDGDLDVLTSEEGDNLGVVWYENPKNQGQSPVFRP